MTGVQTCALPILILSFSNQIQQKADRYYLPIKNDVDHIVSPFKINNINIDVTIDSRGASFINGVRINRNEIGQAVFRASCHNSEENYNLFLKSVSRMSLRRHDILANGFRLKIHENITADEYSSEKPSASAPALKFVLKPNTTRINLYINETKQIPVKMSQLIQQLDHINAHTDNCRIRGYYDNRVRNYLWAIGEVVAALIKCTTITKDVNTAAFVGKVEEKQLTKEDIVSLLSICTEQTKAKIARSKQFLETAVKTTGAELIEFQGQPAYKVAGLLRTYAVIISTAKVYDYDTKKYRCIVNNRQYIGEGYDDVASRLLALKNDSVMQRHITTLTGAGAQPGAENHYNVPERDPDRIIDAAINSAFSRA